MSFRADLPPAIRRAVAGDNALLAELGAQTFFDTFAACNTPQDMADYLAASFSPLKQAAELADPATVFLIAELDSAPIGYARLRSGPAPACVGGRAPIEIVRFYVRREWIGQGLAAQLMAACLRQAEQAGCDVIWLDVWEHNPRAIAFYRKWGFEQAGTQPFQLGSDLQTDLLMARPVVAAAGAGG